MGNVDERRMESIWRAYDEMEVRLTAHVSERMLALAGIGPGMRVLDLATGRGEPAVRAVHLVGPGGAVVGVDSSAAMLALAAERAASEGVALELHASRCEELPEDMPPFDAALARWGLMYFDDPLAALAATRRHLSPGARLVAAVWAEEERVSYHSLPRRALERHRVLPPVDPTGPGVSRYGTPGSLEADLLRAGYHVIHVEELETTVMEVETEAELVAWCRSFGMARLLEGLDEETQRAWERDLIAAAEPLRVGGRYRLGGVTRIVLATA